MREILFRGKSERSGEWVYGSLIVTHGGCVIYSKYHPLVTAPPEKKGDYLNQYVVDPRTVGQYIGWTEKNGKKIFVGNILDYLGISYVVSWSKELLAYIVTSLNKKKDYLFYLNKDNMDKVYVVGNIHDNPEMLEVKE